LGDVFKRNCESFAITKLITFSLSESIALADRIAFTVAIAESVGFAKSLAVSFTIGIPGD
jgi:hypothetical protein